MSPAQLMVQAWLAEMARLEESGPWTLDERGLLGLQTDQGLQIELEVPADADLLYLRAPLGPLPQQDRESVFEKLLALNFQPDQAGGASFAIDAEQHQLALSLCQGIRHLDATDFANLLRSFIAAVVDWRSALADPRQAGLARSDSL